MTTSAIMNQSAFATTTSSSGSSAISEDVLGRHDFLTLLVAQLQNQDPMNPDDPTEFTAQLAQFSSLEQLFNLNDSMETLTHTVESADRVSTLSTIGKEVSYYNSEFTFSGEPVTLGYTIDGMASDVTLTIQKDGATMAVLEGEELTSGTHYVTWDGTTDEGADAPIGDYTITITAKAAEGETVAAAPVIRSEVTGVDLYGPYGGTLVTDSGVVSFHNIFGVFEPESSEM